MLSVESLRKAPEAFRNTLCHFAYSAPYSTREASEASDVFRNIAKIAWYLENGVSSLRKKAWYGQQLPRIRPARHPLWGAEGWGLLCQLGVKNAGSGCFALRCWDGWSLGGVWDTAHKWWLWDWSRGSAAMATSWGCWRPWASTSPLRSANVQSSEKAEMGEKGGEKMVPLWSKVQVGSQVLKFWSSDRRGAATTVVLWSRHRCHSFRSAIYLNGCHLRSVYTVKHTHVHTDRHTHKVTLQQRS